MDSSKSTQNGEGAHVQLLVLGEGGRGPLAERKPGVCVASLVQELDLARAEAWHRWSNLSDSNLSNDSKYFAITDALEGDGDEVTSDLLIGVRTADTSLLLVDATIGALDSSLAPGGQTREHVLLVGALGVRHLAVCVIGPAADEQQYHHVCDELGNLLGLAGFEPKNVPFVPVTKLGTGGPVPDWYSGPALFEALLQVGPPAASLSKRPLRVPLHEVYKLRGSEVVAAANVEMGMLTQGVGLVMSPGNVAVQMRRIMAKNCQVNDAGPGMRVDLVGLCAGNDPGLPPPRFTAGAVLSEAARDPADECKRFLSQFVVLTEPTGTQIRVGYQLTLDVHAAHVPCRLAELCWRRGRRNGRRLEVSPLGLAACDIAEAWIEPLEPVCLEKFSFCPPLGRFALRDRGTTVVAGIIKTVHRTTHQVACFDD